MSLTKKHFIAIAKILATNKSDDYLINDFCYYFKSENGLFSSDKFKDFIADEKLKKVIDKI